MFLRIALQDHLCTPSVLRRAADKLRAAAPEVVIQERNFTHIGAHRSGAAADQIAPVLAFLHKHLGLAPGGGDAPAAAEV